MSVPLDQVDAFTDRPFAGNPAAVCLLPRPADPAWMQRVAAEMNLSETAFVWPDGEELRCRTQPLPSAIASDRQPLPERPRATRARSSELGFGLRWFTPAAEVALCGHATLAAAHVLWERGCLEPAVSARFHTASGVLVASHRAGAIELDFPRRDEQPVEVPAGLEAALGAEIRYCGRSRDDYLALLASEDAVRNLQPDLAALGELPVRGLIVTAAGESEEYDFISRFFAPGVGVSEDPVTGSSHCCLAPFWAQRLGRQELIGYQASARGGFVRVRLSGERVILSGSAVTVLRGELVVGI